MEEGPIKRLLLNIVNYLQKDSKEEKLKINKEEIGILFDASEKEGIIDEEESEMLHSILQFKDIIIREIMTPRTEITALPVNSSIEDVIRIANTEKYSRVPVYENNIDNIVGILYIRDLLKFWGKKGETINLKEVCKKPFFVPGTNNVKNLLRDFRKKRLHMAIVIDEYGGTAGIITLEDILEEIVGNIQDESDPNEKEIIRISENTFIVDARIYLDDFDDYFNTTLPKEKYETLGGFICHLTGKVPAQGERIPFENFIFEINKGVERRIEKVKVFINKGEKPDTKHGGEIHH